MKRLLTLTLIMAVMLAACNAPANEIEIDSVRTVSETSDRITDTTKTTAKKTQAAETSADEAVAEPAMAEEAALSSEAGAEIAGETNAAETTTETAEHIICGSYRSVLPAYPLEDGELEELRAAGEDFIYHDFINISQFDDGAFQVEFRLAIGGSGNDFAVFDTEALGTANWYSFYFDGSDGMASQFNNGEVTVTADGTTAWVTFEGGEPQEYTKTE
jgi:hypothetical protein